MRDHIPDLYFEQYLLGELDEAHARKVEEAPEFKQRIEALRVENAEILKKMPPSAVARRVQNEYETHEPAARRSYGSSRAKPRRALLLAAPALAALALMFVLVFQNSPQGDLLGRSAADTVRLKGSQARLLIYLATDGGVRSIESGETLSAGDRVQVAYNASGARHGAIYSIDGNGELTIHYPVLPTDSTRLEQGGVQRLSRSFTLDDAPHFERFFLVTSDQSFDSRQIATEIEIQGAKIRSDLDASLQLGEPFMTTEFTIRKEN